VNEVGIVEKVSKMKVHVFRSRKAIGNASGLDRFRADRPPALMAQSFADGADSEPGSTVELHHANALLIAGESIIQAGRPGCGLLQHLAMQPGVQAAVRRCAISGSHRSGRKRSETWEQGRFWPDYSAGDARKKAKYVRQPIEHFGIRVGRYVLAGPALPPPPNFDGEINR